MRITRSITALLLSAICSASLSAQACSDLTVTGNGAPGTALAFDISSAPTGALTAIFVGFGGTMPASLGPTGLGLLPPAIPIAIGLADAMGNFGTSIDVPMTLTTQIMGDAQGLSIEFNFPMPGMPLSSLFTFCASDIEAFTAG